MYKGVLTGCNKTHEWMLKWWWKHYSKQNTHPVTFIDFGMSAKAKKWCESHGSLIQVPTPELSPPISSLWEKHLPKEARQNVWFYKPLALLNAPYDINLWIDIDCRVNKSLNSLFNYPFKECAFALDTQTTAKAHHAGQLTPEEAHHFNAGVILYEKANTLIHKWARKTLLEAPQSYGDQDVLNRFLFEEKIEVTHLPKKFNFLYPYEENDETIIYHYATLRGKKQIKEEMSHES